MKRWTTAFDDKNGMTLSLHNSYHGSDMLEMLSEYQPQSAWLLGERQLPQQVQLWLWLMALPGEQRVHRENNQLYQIKKFFHHRNQI